MDINSKVLARINQLERQILVHSYIYYEKNSNIWSDHFYDDHCKELHKLVTEYPTEARLAEWARAFDNYDPSTGYNLPIYNEWVVGKAEYLYNLHFNNKIVLQPPIKKEVAQKTLLNINTKVEKPKAVQPKPKQAKLF